MDGNSHSGSRWAPSPTPTPQFEFLSFLLLRQGLASLWSPRINHTPRAKFPPLTKENAAEDSPETVQPISMKNSGPRTGMLICDWLFLCRQGGAITNAGGTITNYPKCGLIAQ